MSIESSQKYTPPKPESASRLARRIIGRFGRSSMVGQLASIIAKEEGVKLSSRNNSISAQS